MVSYQVSFDSITSVLESEGTSISFGPTVQSMSTITVRGEEHAICTIPLVSLTNALQHQLKRNGVPCNVIALDSFLDIGASKGYLAAWANDTAENGALDKWVESHKAGTPGYSAKNPDNTNADLAAAEDPEFENKLILSTPRLLAEDYPKIKERLLVNPSVFWTRDWDEIRGSMVADGIQFKHVADSEDPDNKIVRIIRNNEAVHLGHVATIFPRPLGEIFFYRTSKQTAPGLAVPSNVAGFEVPEESPTLDEAASDDQLLSHFTRTASQPTDGENARAKNLYMISMLASPEFKAAVAKWKVESGVPTGGSGKNKITRQILDEFASKACQRGPARKLVYNVNEIATIIKRKLPMYHDANGDLVHDMRHVACLFYAIESHFRPKTAIGFTYILPTAPTSALAPPSF